jgi:hypothetical protein
MLYAGRNDVAIVYIYCNYKEQALQTPSNLIASLLKQLIQDHPAAYEHVKPIYKHHNDRRTRPTFEEFRQALQSEMNRFTKSFILVDALDECSEMNETRAKLLTALQSFASTVNVLVTSRDVASISSAFCSSKRLDIHADDQDVRRYIEGRIPHEFRLATHVKGYPALQEEIVKKIIENVQGMYVSLMRADLVFVVDILLYCKGFCWLDCT